MQKTKTFCTNFVQTLVIQFGSSQKAQPNKSQNRRDKIDKTDKIKQIIEIKKIEKIENRQIM